MKIIMQIILCAGLTRVLLVDCCSFDNNCVLKCLEKYNLAGIREIQPNEHTLASGLIRINEQSGRLRNVFDFFPLY